MKDITNLFLHDLRKFGWATFFLYGMLIYQFLKILERGGLLFIKRFWVNFPFKFSLKYAKNAKKSWFLWFFERVTGVTILSSMVFLGNLRVFEDVLRHIEGVMSPRIHFYPFQSDNIKEHFSSRRKLFFISTCNKVKRLNCVIFLQSVTTPYMSKKLIKYRK